MVDTVAAAVPRVVRPDRSTAIREWSSAHISQLSKGPAIMRHTVIDY
jgi:hypothetical protein